MILRLLGTSLFLAVLICGVNGLAHAGTDNGNGNGGQNNGNQFGKNKDAPEIDPSAIGSGIVLLSGGLLLLDEHRRKHKK